MEYMERLPSYSRDPSLLGEDWGLTEEEIDTIGKDGLQLFGRSYVHPELVPYTTGNKSGPRPKLVVRYDRALAARGILGKVKVLEVIEGGKYKPICEAVPREQYTDPASRAEFFAFRREYVRVLKAKRKLAESNLLALLQHERELQKFFDSQRARSRRKPAVERSVSALPITLDDPPQEGHRLGEELQRARARNHSPGCRPGTPKKDSPQAAVRSSGPKRIRGLGTVLGGAVGFVKGEDE
jgi:hypothetical protein